MVDGCRSKLVDVVPGVPQGSVLGPLLFILYTSELFVILENKLIGYADDSNLIAVVPYPGIRVTVAESMSRDLGRVNEWCDLAWVNEIECEYDQEYDSLQNTHDESPVTTINYWQNCTEVV